MQDHRFEFGAAFGRLLFWATCAFDVAYWHGADFQRCPSSIAIEGKADMAFPLDDF